MFVNIIVWINYVRTCILIMIIIWLIILVFIVWIVLIVIGFFIQIWSQIILLKSN